MRTLVIFLLLCISLQAKAQSITTFILVRHAEKEVDGTKDPNLSEAGKIRAQALTKLLSKAKIDAIYTTPFKRTQQTITPLAESKQLTPRQYDAAKTSEEAGSILKNHKGKTIVICGHSNTIPAMANFLTGKETYKNFDDNDYGNILVISMEEKGETSVTWLTY